MPYLLGIDVGTSSAKAVLINTDGEVVFTTAPEYEFRTPKPLWAESDPEDWWAATVEACRQVLEKVPASEIVGLGLTGQMHGLVMLDKEGNVLRPCIMWNDQRTAKQCAEITERVGDQRVLEITGNPVLAGFTAPKVLWVEQNEPEVFGKTAKILLPKDYIRYRLSGGFFTDVSDASGMSLLNVAKRDWSEEMLDACGISRDWVAEATESSVASSKISAEAAKATGLPEGLPIAAGGGDQAAGAVGCGIVREGVVSCTLGTSGVVFAHSDEYRVEPQGRLHAFCHAVPNKWHLMGVQLSSAGSYQWYRKNVAGGEEYAQLDAEAAEAPAGCEGLFFLPYLTGERMPHPDPAARGAFVGLTLRHDRSHMTRSVLEGVTFGLRDGLELMRNIGVQPTEIIASGGGARSPLWRQMLADIFNTRIALVNATEGAAYGAAILGGVGANVWESVEDACDNTIKTTEAVSPAANVKAYDRYYQRYKALYPALQKEFAAISDLVED